MTKDEMRRDRDRLQGILDGIKAGIQTIGPDETDQLRRDTTSETKADIEQRIANLDRKFAEDWRA